MQLIAITSTQFFAAEAAIINELFAAGLPVLHLRKPGASRQQVTQLLQHIDARYYPQISLHAFHEIAGDYQVHRLHFTEQARAASSPDDWQLRQQQGYQLSTSIHYLHQLPQVTAHFSYAFFGPVFSSISKQNYPGIIHQNFHLPAGQKSTPLIALGGITPGNLAQVHQMNFDGAALLGYLWQQPQQAAATITSLLQTIHQLCTPAL